MALSYVTYAGDASTTNFLFEKGYVQTTDVSVYVDGALQTLTTHYTWFSANTIQFVTAPATDAVILLRRETENVSRLVDFQDAGNLTEADLDLSANQTFYVVQEATDHFWTENDEGNTSTALDIDWTASKFARCTLTDNVTFTMTAPASPEEVLLVMVQDGTGSRTATWPATVLWASGTAPTLTTTAAAVDIIKFYFDGTNYFPLSILLDAS